VEQNEREGWSEKKGRDREREKRGRRRRECE